MTEKAIVYTDGSCHTQLKLGAWACLIFHEKEKFVLQGLVHNTTHNRMEIIAVLKALEFLRNKFPHLHEVQIISDSQYVVLLQNRKQKLISKNFLTKAGKQIQNDELVQQLYAYDHHFHLHFRKVKAHQSTSEDEFYPGNKEVDFLVRKHLREGVHKIGEHQKSGL